MSSVRVTYSRLIYFMVEIVSVFTGLIFILLVPRQLITEEFNMKKIEEEEARIYSNLVGKL